MHIDIMFIAICIAAIIALILIDYKLAVALICFAAAAVVDTDVQITGGRHNNELVSYTLGEFKILGGFTTLGESVCRAAIYLQSKEMYGKPLLLMPCTGGRGENRVEWLTYQGVNLELDGLDEQHKIAFEYDGPQHYSYSEWCKMGRGRATGGSHRVLDFYRARFYDRLKTKLCRLHGIRLIRVSTLTTFDAMRNVIKYALAHDYDESRPVDDVAVISSFEFVDPDDSSLFPIIEWNKRELHVPTDKWRPHPFDANGEASIYARMFKDDLREFASHVKQDLLTMLPRGRFDHREVIYRGIKTHFDLQLVEIQPLIYSRQYDVIVAALDDVAREVAQLVT